MTFGEIFIGTAWAQPATSTPSTQGGLAGMFLPMAVVFVIFYFLLIRPQQRERRKLQDLIKNLKKGEAIVTSSGIHGTIVAVHEDTFQLEVADNLRFKIDKAQVARLANTQIANTPAKA